MSYGAPTSSNIAAPGASAGTSGINGSNSFGDSGQAVVGGGDPSTANALIAGLDSSSTDPGGNPIGGLSQFGTGRIRRFALDSPTTCGLPRCDTGIVKVNNASSPISSLFQNISNSKLDPASTFYDGIANIGVVSLLILQPRGFAIDGSGAKVYQQGLIPRISVSDKDRPNIMYQFDTGNLSFHRAYNSSAVFEVALASKTNMNGDVLAANKDVTTPNGNVTALQGGSGLLVLRAAASLPSPSLLGTPPANPAGCSRVHLETAEVSPV